MIVICLVPLLAQSQHSTSLVSRAQVHITPENAALVPQMGLDLTHGTYIPGKYITTDLASWQIEHIRALGFQVDILIDDVTAFYQTERDERRAVVCEDHQYDYRIPKNFEPGSMGGFLTYAELLDALDLMQIYYPELISIRKPTGTEVTYQNRPIYWVRISDNPEQDEAEPEILYTALHHAREPVSMMQMIYYMWYLLEGYGTDPEATYLINNNELYFIPCVNPDGYVYNQTIAPNGGGFWRKNMRDNDNNGVFEEKEDGVDINRNYGYQWGLDDVGSSGNQASETYRGPAPFSEPETRAIREFIEAHDISVALNYHAYGNFFLYPWGYTEELNPDIAIFENYGELLALDNDFKPGTSQETVGYPTNGSSDDWMYADHSIFAMTPEMGSEDDGFWPDSALIIPMCQSSLKNNLALAHLPHQYAVTTELNGDFFTQHEGTIDLRIKSYGSELGDMALTAVSLSPELHIDGNIIEVSLATFEEAFFSINYSLDPSTKGGEQFTFIVVLDNGFFEVRDTLTKTLAGETLAFFENGDDLSEWDTEGSFWGTTTETAHSGSTCLTDSPNGPYPENTENAIQIAEPIDLRHATHALLEYWVKWEIEELIDFAQVQISTDGVNFLPLCGKYTKPGSIFQRPEPLYDGVQNEWVKESIDLSAYIGSEVYLRFVLSSDTFWNLDGIYIDDIRVYVYDEEVTSIHDPGAESSALRVWPNPVKDQLSVVFDESGSPRSSQYLSVTNSLGMTVYRQDLAQTDGTIRINTTSWPSGCYLVQAFSDGHVLAARKVIVE